MVWHLTESRTEVDGTDELPVLTQEAILELESQGQALSSVQLDPLESSVEADPLESSVEADPLESSVEALRDALDLAERRWTSLESRLAEQDQAIDELKGLLKNPEPVTAGIPAEIPALEREPESAPAPAEITAAPENDAHPTEHGLLEKIASLETYIAGRSDRWHEMEQDVDSKARRIAELEIELAQRIAREQRLEERLQDEGQRSNELRDKLRRVNRRLQESELGSADRDLDATRELFGRAIEASRVQFHRNGEATAADLKRAPRLLCLSAELGEPFVMNKQAITIGRAADCDIQIATDFVSRRHATIRLNDSDTIIEDKSSTNGVFVNAERVERQTLNDGDEITIGESRFRFIGGESLD